MQDTRKITLPDLVSLCPFPLRPNPMYDQVRRESAAWIMSFNIFTGHKRDHFVVSDFEMLAAYAHPNAPYDRLRVCADLINHLATMDIMCDDLDGKAVRKVGDQVMAAFHGAPMDDEPVSRMSYEFKQSWDRFVAADSCHMRRYIEHNRVYFNRLTREAELRETAAPLELNFKEFMHFRRENSALHQSFDLIEMACDIDLPDVVTEDEVFDEMMTTGLDLCCITNDIASFKMEESLNLEEVNTITFFQRSRGMTMQEALDHTGIVFSELIDKFLSAKQRIRSFGEDTDRMVKLYIEGMEDWIAGNIHWSYDCGRYFGNTGQEVKASGVVKLGLVEF